MCNDVDERSKITHHSVRPNIMFEFDTQHPHSLEKPPRSGEIVITVVNGDLLLLRCRYLSESVWTWDTCRNWSEIRSDAQKIIERKTNRGLRDGVYPCPPHIQARAQW